MDISKVKMIIFDTFGTVVDWHGTVVEEGIQLGEKYNFSIDWHAFVNTWRDEGYLKAVFETAEGLKPWEPVDIIHRRKLLELIETYGITKISKNDIKHFNLVWHRLKPWPDVVQGLNRLRQRYMIGPFTNGDFRLIIDMAQYSNLPWNFIITAEVFKKFKPDPAIYVDAVNLLGGNPEEVLMVAAHPFDLDGALNAGCSTIYVPRPLEYGENSNHVEREAQYQHEMFKDFNAVADLLQV